MAVDNTLRYRGFNSYELAPNETLYSSLSDCEYLGFVTTQWVALKAGGTIGSGSVRITWIDHTGGQFGSAELYEFTPTRLWERYTWTIAVPPEAVKLRIQFDGGVRGYHFACPMTEPGKIASSFDPNIASAVAYMTSEGAYVGMIAANQVIVSSGEGLEERLVKISGDAILLEKELDDKTTLITADGVYTGTVKAEQLEGGTVYAKEPVVYGPFTEADSDLLQEFILGTKTPTEAQMKKYDLTMDGLLNSHDSIAIYRIRLGLTSGTRYGAVRILPPSPDHVGGIFIGSAEEGTELDETNSFFYMSGGTFKGKTVELYNSITTPMVKGWNASGTAMVEGSHAIGVDSFGPYFTKSGARSYMADMPEIISNSNGTAFKFPSGLMICTAKRNYQFSKLVVNGVASYEIAFPQPFVADPISITDSLRVGDSLRAREYTGNISASSSTGLTYDIALGDTPRSSGSIGYTAIGFWK